MNCKLRLLVLVALLGTLSVATTQAQDEPSGPPPQGQGQGRGQGFGGQRPAAFGKITAVHDGSLEVTGPDGNVVTVKVTPQTEFRKDREPAKVSDFKVGDMIMVRGTQNSDGTVTANMIGGRTGGGMMYSGPAGQRGGGAMMNPGTLGKDYVAGEVKSVDPPKMTVLRTDGVTQTIELTEDTSLRRGRDSITMADIKVGDHVMARGAAQGDNFVPKGVMVMNAEQWQHMQERMSQGQGNANAPASVGTSQPPAPAPKPQE
jgi:Domain of unknown function (DUF5666)